jgi:hypothetical protein
MKTAALLVLLVVGGCKAADDYARKSKMSEARLMLNKIGKSAKVAFMQNDKYPIGKAGPTPATWCCEGPEHKCQPDPAQWQTGVWKELEFQMDEPHLFRYSYESTDGKTFTAMAIGDLDCDKNESTYKAVGVTEPMSGGGSFAKVTIDETPTGED